MGAFMFGFSPGELMNLCPDERLLFVRMISAMLRRSGGDAGAVMFEAYRHIVSDTNQARRSYMTMYTVDIHSCPGYAFRLSERSFRLFIRRPVYRSVRSASDKALLPVRAFAHSRLPRHQDRARRVFRAAAATAPG